MSEHIPDLTKMVAVLREHNRWRRDNDGTVEMANPTQLGIAIDAVCDAVERLTAERDALRTIADGMVVNVRHMTGRCDGTDAALLWELGQWAVNLKSWADEYAAIDAAKGGGDE